MFRFIRLFTTWQINDRDFCQMCSLDQAIPAHGNCGDKWLFLLSAWRESTWKKGPKEGNFCVSTLAWLLTSDNGWKFQFSGTDLGQLKLAAVTEMYKKVHRVLIQAQAKGKRPGRTGLFETVNCHLCLKWGLYLHVTILNGYCISAFAY